MLYLYKNENDSLGAEIQDYLKEVSAAHKVVIIEDEESYLAENQLKIRGKKGIFYFLENFNKVLVMNRSVSGDACYIDPDSGMTC